MKVIHCPVCDEPCGKEYPADQTDPGFREGIGENFTTSEGVWHCSEFCLDHAKGQRFDLVRVDSSDDHHDHIMERCDTGEWIRYDDAADLIRKAKLDTVRALIPEVQRCAYAECILPHGHRGSCKTERDRQRELEPNSPLPKFDNVSCSQCQRSFGPGDHGFSHCENHKGMAGTR